MILNRVHMFALVCVVFSEDHMTAQSGLVEDSSSTSDIWLICEWCGCAMMDWLFHVWTFHFQRTSLIYWRLLKLLLLPISRSLGQQGGNSFNDNLNETGVKWNWDGECTGKFHRRTPGGVGGQGYRTGVMHVWATADVTLHDLTCAIRDIKNILDIIYILTARLFSEDFEQPLWGLSHTYLGLNQAVPYESAVPLWFIVADLDLQCPSLPLKLSDWLPEAASSRLSDEETIDYWCRRWTDGMSKKQKENAACAMLRPSPGYRRL